MVVCWLVATVIKRIKYGAQRISAGIRCYVCQHKILYPARPGAGFKLCRFYCVINLCNAPCEMADEEIAAFRLCRWVWNIWLADWWCSVEWCQLIRVVSNSFKMCSRDGGCSCMFYTCVIHFNMLLRHNHVNIIRVYKLRNFNRYSKCRKFPIWQYFFVCMFAVSELFASNLMKNFDSFSKIKVVITHCNINYLSVKFSSKSVQSFWRLLHGTYKRRTKKRFFCYEYRYSVHTFQNHCYFDITDISTLFICIWVCT